MKISEYLTNLTTFTKFQTSKRKSQFQIIFFQFQIMPISMRKFQFQSNGILFKITGVNLYSSLIFTAQYFSNHSNINRQWGIWNYIFEFLLKYNRVTNIVYNEQIIWSLQCWCLRHDSLFQASFLPFG